MLSAPSSFNRFMAATKKAKEQQERRERQNRVSQGLEVSGDGVEEQAAPSAQQTQENPAASGSDGYTKEKRGGAHDKTSTKSDRSDDDDDGDDGPAFTWLRPDLGDGGVEWEEEGARDAKRGKKGKGGAKTGGVKRGEVDDETNGKRKHMSLRERKREARKVAKTAKDEDATFMYGQASEKQERSRGGDPSFGEVADAPPTITLKRKSGGKGAKPVPVALSGHKIAGDKGVENRQAQIFKELMQTAHGKYGSTRGAGAPAAADVGLRRVAELKTLREQAIVEYRNMRGRPMNNGRSPALAVDPSRLFSATVGAATIRRDAGKGTM